MSHQHPPAIRKKRTSLLIISVAVIFGYSLAKSDANILKPWAIYRAQADFNSGYRALARGDDLIAVSYFERGLEKDPENTHAQQQLDFLLMKYRQVAKAQLAVNEVRIVEPAQVQQQPAPHYTAPIPSESPSSFITAASANPAAAIDLGTPNGTFLRDDSNEVDYRDLQQRLLTERAYDEHNPSVYQPANLQKRRIALSEVKVGSESYVLNEQGYRSLREGREAEAIAAFEHSLRRNPDQSIILRQLGYLHKSRGEDKKAAASFKKALKLGGLDVKTEKHVKKEVDYLDDRWKFNANIVYRANQFDTFETAVSGPSLAQSQSSFQGEYRPNLTPGLNPHHLTAFSRILVAHLPGSYDFDTRTYQLGLGVKGKPLPSQNLYLSAERLVAIGAFSRNDWLLRASWSTGTGYEPPEGKRSWFNWSFYADAALINPSNPDVFGTAKAQFGRSWQIGPDDFKTFVRPFINISAVYQDAADFTTTLVEAGPGLEFSMDTSGNPLFFLPNKLNVGAEYRQRIAGNSFSPSGILLYLDVNF